MSHTRPISISQEGAERSPSNLTGEASDTQAKSPHGAHLPVQFTAFVGRERESAAVRQLLLRGDVRLLTLVGPPGIGKTRLAIQVAAGLAADFRDGVHFVSLGPIRDPALIVPAIAETVGVRETAGEPLLVTLQTYLKDRAALLVLDNFEHVAEAAQHLADLLSECAHVKALVTSRELLHLYGEQDYPVPPLSLPDPGKSPDLDSLSEYEAVALFVQRARGVDPGFRLTEQNARAVAEVCLQLDGLPLAIELAAARVLVLRPEDLPARLKSRLKLLTGGARNLPERQRTIRAAIEWSYNLLEPGEQALFRGLGVFAGGCTVEAIEQVCGGSDPQIEAFDGVTSLVGKSLLQRQAGAEWAGGAEPRFVMLETIREFAREKLRESGELDATCDRHLEYFTQVAEKSDQETLGVEVALWMRRLDADQNNMRAALEWSLTGNDRAGGPRAELGVRLVGALGRYWQFRSYLSEGRQWCALLLDKTESAGPSVDRARALRALARFEFELSDSVKARRLYEQSLAISRALGDGQGEAATLLGLGILAMWQGAYDLSRSVFEESLAISRKIGARSLIASAVGMIGVIHMRNEEYRAAQTALEEALALNREEGNDAAIADTLVKQGSVAIHLGEYEKAKALIEEGIGISRDMGLEWVTAFSLARLGLLALRQGDPQHAETFLLEALDRAQRTGVKRWSRWYLVGLAEVARLRGRAERAAKLIGASGGAATGPDAHYEPATRGEIERIVAGVRAEVDEETFERLSAEGRAMSLDEIMAFAAATGRTAGTGTVESPQANPADLTEREVEVLRLMALGKSNQEIGQELVLSRRTVERHISNIYEKIGASGKVARAAATAYALRHGIAT